MISLLLFLKHIVRKMDNKSILICVRVTTVIQEKTSATSKVAIYLKTFVLDKLFNSINNKQLPFIIEVTKITRMYPTLCIYSKICGLWIFEVTW